MKTLFPALLLACVVGGPALAQQGALKPVNQPVPESAAFPNEPIRMSGAPVAQPETRDGRIIPHQYRITICSGSDARVRLADQNFEAKVLSSSNAAVATAQRFGDNAAVDIRARKAGDTVIKVALGATTATLRVHIVDCPRPRPVGQQAQGQKARPVLPAIPADIPASHDSGNGH